MAPKKLRWCLGRFLSYDIALAGVAPLQKQKIAYAKTIPLCYAVAMKLQTHMVEKPWGREDIDAAFGAPSDKRIGEIWYDDGREEQLPLLVKWLFTSEKLSVQVHPNDTQAQARGAVSGKEECWYIVSAQPGATLGMGTKQPMSSEELREASLDGSIEAMIDWKPVKAGDYYYIPAGTVHAIGAGITLVEVQQYADITYRLYDYGRLDKGKPRELHLDDGVAVSRAQPYSDKRSGHAKSSRILVDGPHFRLWLVINAQGLDAIPTDKRTWITPLSGEIVAGGVRGIMGDCLLAIADADIHFEDGASCLIATEM
jgi:mannose-6-phosphate isomerase